MAKTSNKLLKARLKKVIHVLYPEYKHISIKNNLNAVLSKHSNWFVRLFSKKDRASYGLLTSHYIPKKLTLLKYNNKDFLSTVIEDMTSAEMRGENLISHFYTEIIRIKYPHVFREFSIPEVAYLRNENPCDEDVIDIVITRTKEKVSKAVKQTFIMRLQLHPLYYEYMVIGAIALTVGLLYLLKLI